MRSVAGLLVALACGCVQPSLVDCPSGNQCADGQACDTVHGGCVDPEQNDVCNGKVEGDTCSWSTQTGRCFDGVCIVPGCGNLVVEDGEQCDDGNRVSNDGCSADCTSTEICGNGFVDVAEGEECDDGNLRSHDGCDSTCHAETIAWRAAGVAPQSGTVGHGAYDTQRDRFVHVADGLTWEWDGAAWTLAATTGLPATPSWFTLAYDSDRHATLYLGSVAGAADTFAAWDGTAWTPLDAPGSGIDTAVTAYDPLLHRLILIGTRQGTAHGAKWDDGTATWDKLAPPLGVPVTDGGQALAFDKARGAMVLYAGGTNRGVLVNPVMYDLSADDIWVQDGNATIATSLSAPSIVFDDTRNTLVAVGAGTTEMHALTKSGNTLAWTLLGAKLPAARDLVELFYDPKGAQVVAFGGRDTNAQALDDTLVNTAVAVNVWAPVALAAPRAASAEVAALDGRRGTLVLVQTVRDTGLIETWTFANGAWTLLTMAAFPGVLDAGAAMGYDPVRDALVLVTVQGQTFSFDPVAQAWSVLSTGAPGTPWGVIFDPERGELVVVANDGTATLASSAGAQWQPLTSGPPFKGATSATVGYDAREHAIQAISGDAVAVQLVGQTDLDWGQTLSPGDHYRLVGDPRLGGVDYVSPRGVSWQRVGTSFTQSEGQPLPVDGEVLSNPITGDLLVLGTPALGDALNVAGESRVLLTRSATSASHEEDCSAGAGDKDGDGLAGCDDPDCFWTCTPACPPFASCP